ncbi:MAG: cupredoxin domain-containing protein [Candidatus Sungbacteria bacterium]|uniref:Cupredoxin domain-containing protein n=1 Tax=Candidatus Sungiibacteriota bacterium TaxID=2750080 RepID=A0A9D6LQJ0_9BACT|nr:cupredoxin domain-containing protein [Candidatus Sungbacteria bacterium]
MNKYLILIIVGLVILVAGMGYRYFILPRGQAPVITGNVKAVTIVAKKNQWRFLPDQITVIRGDKIVATVVNEDDYDHGLAIDAYGVSQRMPANSTITIEFTVTQEGDFSFYCSVPCGEGVVDGKKRTHFDMVGVIHVVPASS